MYTSHQPTIYRPQQSISIYFKLVHYYSGVIQLVSLILACQYWLNPIPYGGAFRPPPLAEIWIVPNRMHTLI